MKIKPLADRVLIEEMPAKEKTSGGILLPETAKEKPQQAKVVEVGEGKFVDGKKIPLDVKKGDVVLFSKYAGDDVTVENKTYKIVKADDILAVIS